jgi:tetratricopeptide (TPR) repeat protein
MTLRLLTIITVLHFSLLGYAQYSIDSLYQLTGADQSDTLTELDQINNILSHPLFIDKTKIRQYVTFRKGFIFKNRIQNFDSAIYYFDLALNIDTTNHIVIRKIFNHRGDLARVTQDSMAIFYFEQALIHNNRQDKIDSVFNYRIYANVALALVNEGKYEVALNMLQESLDFFEKLQSPKRIAIIYSQMAVIYYNKKDFSKALEYEKKSYHIRLQHNLSGLINSGFNLAKFYTLQENNEKAMIVLEDIIQLNRQQKISSSLFRVYLLKADILCKRGNKEGLFLIDSLLQENPVNSARGELYLSKAEYFFTTKNFKQSELNLKKSLEIINDEAALQEIYPFLMKIYEKTQQFKLAIKYSKLKDSLNEKIFRDNFIRLEREFDYTKEREEKVLAQKEKEIAELKAAELKAQNERNLFYTSIIVVCLVVLILIGILFFTLRRAKQKSEKMRLEQKLLTSQMNPHFISNAMGVLQTYIVQSKVDDSLSFLSSFAKLSRGILSSSKEDFISLEEEVDILKNYINIQQRRYQFRVQCTFEYDASLIDEELLILPMLVQPLVENAFEYGTLDGKGEVNLDIKNAGEYISITVQDKGKGIDQNKLQGKRKSYSSGIIKERIDMFNSKHKNKIKMSLDSSEKGTRIEILFPKLYLI